MSSDTPENLSSATGAEVAEHERQFREILEFCPAALLIVDDDGRLLFHNARLRELLGYREDELDRIDTSSFLARPRAASKIIASLRDRGGQLLNEKVVWRTKTGQLLEPAADLAQVAYRGGHISFVGGKRVCGSTTSRRRLGTGSKSLNRNASSTKSWITVRRPWASSTTRGVFSSTIGGCATS